MSTSLRVLFVGDSESVTTTLVRQLQAGNYDPTCERVDTPVSMGAALDRHSWDLVIADYALARFSGLAALALIRERNLDLPLIIVSDTIGEDLAVAAMQAGANEYVRKAHLARLVPAVERELREAAVRRDRTRAENALRDSEERYRLLFEANPHPMWVYDADTLAFLAVNDAAIHHYGYTRAEFYAMTIEQIRPAEDVPALHAQLARGAQGISAAGRWRHRKKNGTLIDVEITTHPLIFAGRRAKLVLAYDITERKQAEEELLKLRKAVETSGEVVFLTDQQGTITFVNPEFTKLYGYTAAEVVGKTTPRILKGGRRKAADYEQFWKTILNRQVIKEEFLNKTKDGRLVDIEASVNPVLAESGAIVGFLAIQRDITERKQLEEQFRQAQKMEAIGRLAGGVAHDFNNLLTAIKGYTEFLLDSLDLADPRHKDAEEIKLAAERAASLTRQLLAFSRRQVLAPKVLHLAAVVSTLEKMLRRLIGEDIDLVTVQHGEPGRVNADPGQLEQVILNLVVNARDAMPSGGKLTIETANVELDEAYARQYGEFRPGRFVMLAVSDTGCGMDAETQSHIFEPFFTTKGPGQGTGLGLSTVYGIVKQSGGHISVSSEPGQGTTFKIYLPRVDETADALTATATPTELPRGVETILLVEDEEAVRSLAREALRRNGYTVLEAARGDEALRIVQHHAGPIHLMLTDVVMPQMNGRELVARLASARPQMKVVYMSGYTDHAIVHQGVLERGLTLLQKPFSPDALARRIREVLDAGGPPCGNGAGGPSALRES